MDENDNNNANNPPQEQFTAAEANEMKAEGVEIMGQGETPTDRPEPVQASTPVAQPKIEPVTESKFVPPTEPE